MAHKLLVVRIIAFYIQVLYDLTLPFLIFAGLPDPPVVVGVVGIGHVTGIVQKFNTVCPTDVAKVIQLPPTSQSSKYIKSAIRGVFWTLTAYGIYKVLQKSGVSTLIPRTLSK